MRISYSFVVAIVGFSVSLLGEYPGTTEATEPAPQRGVHREIELLQRRPTSKSANTPPRVPHPRPSAPYTAPRSQGSHDPGTPPPVYTPQKSQRTGVPSSLLPESIRPPLMLHRQVNQAVGQAPRNPTTFTVRIKDPQTRPIGRKTRVARERDMWKQKFLAV